MAFYTYASVSDTATYRRSCRREQNAISPTQSPGGGDCCACLPGGKQLSACASTQLRRCRGCGCTSGRYTFAHVRSRLVPRKQPQPGAHPKHTVRCRGNLGG